jgi:hypothetical protein
MKKHIVTISALSAFILSPLQLSAQAPSLDDFMAPVADDASKGKKAPTEIQNPEQVSVTKEQVLESGPQTPVVEAGNTQDAINAAVKNNINIKTPITEIKVGSGRGVVCSGTSGYEVYENRNASLISKRLAYVKAFADAKKNLTQHLHGLSPDAKEDIVGSVDAYDSGSDSLANTMSGMNETNETKVEGMIRGYTIYSINDDTEKREVTVNIVTTPKTRGETMRATSGLLFAKDFKAGMEKVYSEIKAGVLPPAGSRVITVKSNGKNELFFVAFGSEINRINKNPQVERELRKQSAQVAQQRAAAGLVALISGESSAWKGGFTNKNEEANKQFEEVPEGPESQNTTIVPVDETISTFKNRLASTSAYSFAQKGKLPPGLNAIMWESEDGDWTYAAYIYNPSLTSQAEKTRDAMTKGPGILERGNSIGTTSNSNSYPSISQGASSDRTDFGNSRPINQGATGSATTDDDL